VNILTVIKLLIFACPSADYGTVNVPAYNRALKGYTQTSKRRVPPKSSQAMTSLNAISYATFEVLGGVFILIFHLLGFDFLLDFQIKTIKWIRLTAHACVKTITGRTEEMTSLISIRHFL